MKRLVVSAALGVLVVFSSQLIFAQSSDELKALKDEVKALKEGQAAIQKDLQEIKNLLRTQQAQPQAPPAFKEAVVSIDAGHVKGDKDAKLVMIDFSDYQ